MPAYELRKTYKSGGATAEVDSCRFAPLPFFLLSSYLVFNYKHDLKQTKEWYTPTSKSKPSQVQQSRAVGTGKAGVVGKKQRKEKKRKGKPRVKSKQERMCL